MNEYDRLAAIRMRYLTDESVLKALDPLLPKTTPAPKCLRDGHDWTEARTPLARETEVRACRRCARRGYIVFRSEAA